MYIILGFIVSSVLVVLARITYLYFFATQCLSIQCITQIGDNQLMFYGAIILIGTYNTYLMSKHGKYTFLAFEFIGTFLFAFAMNFVDFNQ